MKSKYLICGAYIGMISCLIMSAKGATTLDPFTGCCSISRAECHTNNDCGASGGGCVECNSLLPDQPCISPKVWDDNQQKCVCPTTSTAVCSTGYYFSEETCKCEVGSSITWCSKDQYPNGTICTNCPENGKTLFAGSESVTSCYLPSGTEFSDETGSGTYTDDCYYIE